MEQANEFCPDAIILAEALNLFQDASNMIPEGDPGATTSESLDLFLIYSSLLFYFL